MEKSETLNFELKDLLDIEMIQKMQDSFSLATGVASIITNTKGVPLTKPSNFCGLCNLIRKTEIGKKNCYHSDSILGNRKNGGQSYQKCLSGGMWDGGATIMVGEKPIANWLIGQIVNEDSDEKLILDYAKVIGADEEEYKAELSKVRRMPLAQFKLIAESLSIFANILSEKAYHNLLLRNQQEHLELLVKEKTEELETTNEELRAINEELYEKHQIIQNQNSEMKQMLDSLKEARINLIQADKMASLGTLAAGVAHEINNPLNFIHGAYNGLAEYFEEYGSLNKDKTDILLNSINVGVERVSGIVSSLNQFSRTNELMNEKCEIHMIIDNCLLILNNKLKYNIEVIKDYFKGKIYVVGNSGKLHQVFVNILNNSIQAIKDTGIITVSTKIRNNNVIIVIQDNGIGIDKPTINRVFDPFYTTKGPGEGTGLGLFIVYNIIIDHHGTIKMESEVDKGTSLIIKFKCEI